MSGATPSAQPALDNGSITQTAATELQGLVDDALLPGAILTVECNGITLQDVTVGWQDIDKKTPLTEDTVFRLYSMSKPITSVAVAMLADQGKLSLTDPVTAVLPEFTGMQVYVSGGLEDMVTDSVARPITIRDLLLHTSGIAYHFSGTTPVHQYYRKYGVMRDTPVGRRPGDGPPAPSLDVLVKRIADAPLLHQPGGTFHYSYSTTVLGAVIERVTGQDLETALRTMIFEPLGMTDTGFFVSEEDLPRFTTLYTATAQGLAPVETPERSDYRDRSRLLDGGGALASTASDYMRFARMLANGGELDGHRLLSGSAVSEMFEPHIQIPAGGNTTTGFGYGFAIGNEATERAGGQPAGMAGWSGSGNTHFLVDPGSGLVALFMTHVLTAGDQASRGARFRNILHRAAVRARATAGATCF